MTTQAGKKSETNLANEQSTDGAVQKNPASESIKSRFNFLKTKKAKITLSIIGSLVLLLVILFVIPVTRYGILGSFMRKDISLRLVDSKTGKAVTDAQATVGFATAYTDNTGKVVLQGVPVGEHTLQIKKKYFKDIVQSVTVPAWGDAQVGDIQAEATGRQVPVAVINKISGAAAQNVTVTVADTTAITDDHGETTLVLPADTDTAKATFRSDSYNDLQANITITDQKDDKNTFGLVAKGQFYFLSKRTGKINVMKANLDGSDPKVVLAGTGKEQEGETVLLASRDWKYLLLKSHRDSDHPKLYLINTATDQLSVVDEGNAEFSLVGWHNHSFVFKVERLAVKDWQPKRMAVKSFDADSSKLQTLDETAGEGTNGTNAAYEQYASINIIDTRGVVILTKAWYGQSSGKQVTISSVEPNGANKKVLKTFAPQTYMSIVIPYEADELYFATFEPADKKGYYEYEDGAVKENKNIKDSDFTQFYPTYLLSPSGQKTFWYEPRDGKNTLLIGDATGKDGKEIAALSEYTPYGWYTDNYLLVSKGGSELYIVPADGANLQRAIKLTDYHKPSQAYRGYGGGYGGGF